MATKLRDFRQHLLELQRKIRRKRTGLRDTALACIQDLDEMEDSRPLTEIEAQERRSRRAEVAEVHLKYEMDWRQRIGTNLSDQLGFDS